MHMRGARRAGALQRPIISSVSRFFGEERPEAMPVVKQLAEALLEEGLISLENLEEAMGEQRRLGRPLGRILIDKGFVTESNLIAALAKRLGLQFVDLTE